MGCTRIVGVRERAWSGWSRREKEESTRRRAFFEKDKTERKRVKQSSFAQTSGERKAS